jgi:hypothetical protein
MLAPLKCSAAKIRMILVCWRPQWCPRRPPVGVATCYEVIYPVGLSTLQFRGPCSLLATHWQPSVEPPCTYSPISPMRAPSKRSSVQWTRSDFPVSCRGAQHAPVMRPPFTFASNLWPGFEFSPHTRAGPRAAALGDEGVGLSGELVKAQHTVVHLPNPRDVARDRHCSVHVQVVACQVSPHIMLCTQAV